MAKDRFKNANIQKMMDKTKRHPMYFKHHDMFEISEEQPTDRLEYLNLISGKKYKESDIITCGICGRKFKSTDYKIINNVDDKDEIYIACVNSPHCTGTLWHFDKEALYGGTRSKKKHKQSSEVKTFSKEEIAEYERQLKQQ